MYLTMMTTKCSDIKVCLEDFGDSDGGMDDAPHTTDLQHLSTDSHHMGNSTSRLAGSSNTRSEFVDSAPFRSPSPSPRRFQPGGYRRKGPYQTNMADSRKENNSAMTKIREQSEPRQSLLGRPISISRPNRRDMQYRRLQAKVYNFLERPKDSKSLSYHLLVFLMVFLCLLLSVFSTIEQYEEVAEAALYHLEMIMVIWFLSEFIIRVWSAGCRSRYQQLGGRLQFMRRPLCIVDVVVTSASIVILCLGTSGQVFATSALRGLRFFQILRMVRVDRRGGSWKLLGSVVWAHRQELFTTLYIGFLGLIFSSFLIFIAEKEKNPKKFGTYADALWWGVITLCTVGYGDTVPITWPGKLIASFCALLGISFFALPAGILGSGFALKVQQQQRQKHLTRRKGPASILIQSLWRCYAADEKSSSVATWKPHLRPHKQTTSNSQKLKPNSSFMSRLSTRRREGLHPPGGGGSTPSPGVSPSPMFHARSILRRNNWNNNGAISPYGSDDRDLNTSGDSEQRTPGNDVLGHTRSNSRHRRYYENRPDNEGGDDLDESGEELTQLTEVHKRAIRVIRKIQYFVARKKFKEAFRPYDVKDVIEQYSAGNLDMLTRIKTLQGKLDLILGVAGSKKADVYDSKISLASRIVKIERQVDDIESKLDTLIEFYNEDRGSKLAQCVCSTPAILPSLSSAQYSTSSHVTEKRAGASTSDVTRICASAKRRFITAPQNTNPYTSGRAYSGVTSGGQYTTAQTINTTSNPNRHSCVLISSSELFQPNSEPSTPQLPENRPSRASISRNLSDLERFTSRAGLSARGCGSPMSATGSSNPFVQFSPVIFISEGTEIGENTGTSSNTFVFPLTAAEMSSLEPKTREFKDDFCENTQVTEVDTTVTVSQNSDS